MVEKPGAGHNFRGPLTRETVAFFTGQYTKQVQVCKSAQKELSRIKNSAAKAGIKLEPFMMMLKARDENSDLVFERLATFKSYCRFMGIPIGGQLDLFESVTEPEPPHNDEDAGYLWGLQDEPPEEQGAAYMSGYHKGVVEAAARHMEMGKIVKVKKRHADSSA